MTLTNSFYARSIFILLRRKGRLDCHIDFVFFLFQQIETDEELEGIN